MGRKSLVAERREHILDAFERSILERGIQASSFQHIAHALGMDRKIISHYFGSREALVDAMTQRIVDAYDARVREVVSNPEQSADVLEIVDAFYGDTDARERIEILWAEIVAYATRSETVRDRLRRSYDALFRAVGEMVSRDYPAVPHTQLETAAYTIAVLLDRSSTLDWIGVPGSPTDSAKAAIRTVLAGLE